MKMKMKTIAYAAPTKLVTQLAKDLRAGGYEVAKTPETLVAKMDGVEVCRALKMRSTWAIRAVDGLINAEQAG